MSSETVRDCRNPWTWAVVGTAGELKCCCFASAPVGDLSRETPEEAWNNLTIQSLRASLRAGVVHTACRWAACRFVEGSRAAGEAACGALEDAVLDGAPDDFDEDWYVRTHVDVAYGIHAGRWKTGREHFIRFGHREFRQHRPVLETGKARAIEFTQPTPLPYLARLSWVGAAEAQPSSNPRGIRMRIRIENAGSAAWPADGSIRLGGRLYKDLRSHGQPALAEVRAALPGISAQGASAIVDLEFPTAKIPSGCSFLVVDVVWEHRFWFSAESWIGPERVLVLGVEKTGTDTYRLVPNRE